ncbi:MAG: SOS response-associated peptidase [Pirellula sp.]
MCGRFTLKTPVFDWLVHFLPQYREHWQHASRALLDTSPRLALPRWNIAPTQDVFIVSSGGLGQPPILASARWGLVPAWSDSLRGGYTMINARSETLHEKPSFKSLLANHRCVLLADGYYEWQQSSVNHRAQAAKTPYWIHPKGELPLAMAGLWTVNRRAVPGSELRSTTIVTMAADEQTQSVHDRMPVMLPTPEAVQQWLNLEMPVNALETFWNPEAGCKVELELRRVSAEVNSVRKDHAALIHEDVPTSSSTPGPSEET